MCGHAFIDQSKRRGVLPILVEVECGDHPDLALAV
jgi:hypothetical protein